MNRQAKKCQHCKQPFEPRRIDQKYCRHRCRQAAYRQRQAEKRATRKCHPLEKARPALLVTCEHCGGTFWAKRERARFCSTSCRTMYHRALKAALPIAIHQLSGLAERKAEDLVEQLPIGRLRELLESAGYEYIHEERRWLMLSG